jgi:hypothetical protein
MLFPGAPWSSPCTNCAPRSPTTTSSPMLTRFSAIVLAHAPEKRTLTCPLLRRRRKSFSANRNAHWRIDEEYGHMSVTTPLNCFDPSSGTAGDISAIGTPSILVFLRRSSSDHIRILFGRERSRESAQVEGELRLLLFDSLASIDAKPSLFIVTVHRSPASPPHPFTCFCTPNFHAASFSSIFDF